MFIASCSVLPSRIENIDFKTSVSNLCKNERIEKVFIHYPKTCARLNYEEYPSPPEWMSENDKIVVNHCIDLGPLTKIAPLLDIYEPKSDLGVFLFDDDRLYPSEWIDDLLSGFERHNRNAAVGRHGSLHKYIPFRYDTFNLTLEDEPFLSIKTTFGAVYPFQAFPPSTEAAVQFLNKYKDQGSTTNDDMMLAAWCFRTQTPIYIIPTSINAMQEWEDYNQSINDEVSLSRSSNHVRKQLGLASAMIQQGDFPCPWSDIGTVLGIVVFVVLLIVFLIFMMRM
jgi:hypothetical protein